MSVTAKAPEPKLHLTQETWAGRRVVEVRNMMNPPTFEEATRALEESERRLRMTGTKVQIRWQYTVGSLPGHWTAFCRCECGEIAFCGEACQTCRLLASLLIDSPTSGPLQVRFERADRALTRLAPVLERLQREAKGQPG